MLGPEHGDTHVGIGHFSQRLGQTVNLVAEHDAHGIARGPFEDIDAAGAGFDCGDLVATLLQLADTFDGIPGVIPRDGLVGAECCLGDFLLGSRSTPAASQVRKNDPTLYMLRTFSSSTETGRDEIPS
jgi:hypothetical protein